MCYQEPCVKCLHCGKCVVACHNKLNKEIGRSEESFLSGNYSITFNDAGLPPGTTVSIDPPMYSVLVKRASTPEMSDDDAFDLMDSIRKERYGTDKQGMEA